MTRAARGVRWGMPGVLALVVSAACAACAPRLISLPSDPGTPFADVVPVHAQVASACRGARTWQAELNLSGRAGAERLRGRVHAGFERPDAMRLEAVPPIGAPLFILAARGGTGTLLLPREASAVRDAPPEAMLGAVTGVSLAPADLLAVLTGCVEAAPQAVAGRLHDNGWLSISLEGGATLFLQRRGGSWEVRVAQRDGWRVEYRDWMGGFPRAVRLQSDDRQVDVTAAVAQLEINVPIQPAAFEVVVPPGTFPLSIEELRAAGPLRDETH